MTEIRPSAHEDGPRVFHSRRAAFDWRARRGGRVFVPTPPTGEVFFFPAHMTPTPILHHALTRSLDGHLVTDPSEIPA